MQISFFICEYDFSYVNLYLLNVIVNLSTKLRRLLLFKTYFIVIHNLFIITISTTF